MLAEHPVFPSVDFFFFGPVRPSSSYPPISERGFRRTAGPRRAGAAVQNVVLARLRREGAVRRVRHRARYTSCRRRSRRCKARGTSATSPRNAVNAITCHPRLRGPQRSRVLATLVKRRAVRVRPRVWHVTEGVPGAHPARGGGVAAFGAARNPTSSRRATHGTPCCPAR